MDMLCDLFALVLSLPLTITNELYGVYKNVYNKYLFCLRTGYYEWKTNLTSLKVDRENKLLVLFPHQIGQKTCKDNNYRMKIYNNS